MGNFYTDNPDLKFHLDRPEFDEIISLQEHNFKDSDMYPFAPSHVADARDSYQRVMEIVGSIAANEIAPYASDVDISGCTLDRSTNKVSYAEPTNHALDFLSKADLMGFTIPRKYGGINLPYYMYSQAIEIISRADASLMNLFGLQEIAATINDFADEAVKEQYLPRLCRGEATAAMVLTEPDAGSDLQSVRLAASYDQEKDQWFLNGVKRFITNGCGDVLLVLARSEPGTSDARGLSMFLCDGGPTVQIRRIEDKMGIHGSPTCEMEFHNTPAILIGKRKMGLIRYVMALMNGARLGVACQGLGVSEAAFRIARQYADERIQFKRPILQFPAVAEMLSTMRLSILISRSLIMESSYIVDLERLIKHRVELGDKELRSRSKLLTRRSALFTPLSKLFATEAANDVTYKAVQILGGSGYMKDFAVERLARDARITNIYEGTSQLQVVAAVGGILSGVATGWADDFRSEHDLNTTPVSGVLKDSLRLLDAAITSIQKKDDSRLTDLHAGRIVNVAMGMITLHLLARDARRDSTRNRMMELHADLMIPRMEHDVSIIDKGLSNLAHYPEDFVGSSLSEEA